MKKLPFYFIALVLILVSCKKDSSEPEDENVETGAYPGKVKSINGNYWKFYYTEDGKLSEYEYNYFGIIKSATLTWESGQVTCNDGIGYIYTRPLNSAGYATPGNNDQQTGNDWTYDVDNHVTSLNGIDYYWSNGNIDSLKLGNALTVFEYTSYLETRDLGARFVPLLTNFPVYNLNLKNLVSRSIQFDAAGDTSSIRLYSYSFDGNNRVTNETVHVVSNGDTSYLEAWNYLYYE